MEPRSLNRIPVVVGDRHPTADGPTRRPTARNIVLFAAPFVVGAVVTFALFHPGHASGDTATPYLEALGRNRYPIENWHPTMNYVIFRLVLQVWESSAALVALQCVLVWGGLAGTAYAIQQRSVLPVARYFVPIGFLPFVFNYVGALIKDTLSAGLTVVALAVLLVERTTVRRRRSLLLGAALLLWPAYLVKISALPIIIALLVYIALRLELHRGRWTAIGVGGVAVIVGFAGLNIAADVVDDVVGAREANIHHALELYDLSGITHFSGTNALGEDILPSDRVDEVIDGECYDSTKWDPLAWGPCSFVFENAFQYWQTDELSQRWRDAVREHPTEYIQHRLNHLGSFSLNPGTNQFYYDYVDDRLDWVPGRNVVMDTYGAVISATDDWPHARPITWQLASAALLGVFVRRHRRSRSGPFDAVLIAAMVGNLLFFAAWLAIGVSSEFRYSYTAILTCLIGGSILLSEAVSRRHVDGAVVRGGSSS